METNAQREAIAKACPHLFWRGQYEDNFEWNTDPLNDLNAMHEAEKMLIAGQINTYLGYLYDFTKVAQVGSNPWEIIAARVAVHATAAQRAEAFLRTLNLWTD